MHDYLRVNGIESTATKREIMHCIKHVCLANSIASYKAVELYNSYMKYLSLICNDIYGLYYKTFTRYRLTLRGCLR